MYPTIKDELYQALLNTCHVSDEAVEHLKQWITGTSVCAAILCIYA